MLSISGAMSPGSGLTHYFTGEDYYVSCDGSWQGKGAAALGLTAAVTKEQFARVSRGLHPSLDQQLVAGKNTGNGKRKQAGNDLTFSAPKSVSIASILDDRIKTIHDQAVENVVKYIEKNNMQTRQQAGGERLIIDTHNLTAARFTHLTSREMDPQLHTHVFLFNLTLKSDGKWRALYNRSIFQDKKALGQLYRNELAFHLQKAGYKIEITDRVEGYFRLKGVPQNLEDHFSARRKQIQAKIKNPKFRKKYPNAGKATLAQIAALGTRARKKQISPKKLEKHWLDQIEKQGFKPNDLKNNISRKAQAQPFSHTKKEQIIEKTIMAVTENESAFRKTQLLKAATMISFGQNSLVKLEQNFSKSTKPKIIGNINGRNWYSTEKIIKLQKTILATVKAAKGKGSPIADKQQVTASIREAETKNGWHYTSGQKAAIISLATSRDKVLIIQGDAGTGKTAAMSIFNMVAHNAGYTIKGLGFTGKSAEELEKGAGIKSQTIDSFLQTLENKSKKTLKKREILLVDESSMTGIKHFAAILDQARKTDTTVIFVGDKKQFRSVSAGRIFQDLQSAAGVDVHAKLTEVIRQKTIETKQVVAAFSAGNAEKATELLEKQKNLTEYKSESDLRRAAVQKYVSAYKKGEDVVVITSTNDARRQINHQIKTNLTEKGIIPSGHDHMILIPNNIDAVRAGQASSYKTGQIIHINASVHNLKAGASGQLIELNPETNTMMVQVNKTKHTFNIDKIHSRITAYDQVSINFSKNDRIIFTKNDKKLGVKNGQNGVVENIDSRGNITVKTGGKKVSFSLTKQLPGSGAYTYQHIDHGMAITAYKSQGATYDRVIWHAPTNKKQSQQIDSRSAYVAATRAKRNFEIITDNKYHFCDTVTRQDSKESVLNLLKNAVEKTAKYGKEIVKEKIAEVEAIMEL